MTRVHLHRVQLTSLRQQSDSFEFTASGNKRRDGEIHLIWNAIKFYYIKAKIINFSTYYVTGGTYNEV